jgi:D-glycero-D-manno-heptose 1,7-bisphosphate phosphatase
MVDMANQIKLIILDRDGVINQDSDAYIKSPDEWIPIPGSLQAIAALKATGWTVAIATNQSGLARGLFDEPTLQAIHAKMSDALAELQGAIDYLVWCPHGPDDECDCRKPRPGLYQQIAHHFDCALTGASVIGDSKRDLEAAVAVGARPVLVTTGKGQRTVAAGQLPAGTQVYTDLHAAVTALLATEHLQSTMKS